MINAYKIGIEVSLLNNASMGLLALSSQFKNASKEADALHGKINKIKMLLGTSLVLTGAGMFGIKMFGDALKSAEEYTHQLNILNNLGMKQVDIAKAVRMAWDTTNTVKTATPTQNIGTFIDLREILGESDLALKATPGAARIEAMIKSSTIESISKNAREHVKAIYKTADMMGYAKDPEKLSRFAELELKMIEQSQGRITPLQMQQVMMFARQSRYGLSEEFLFQHLPVQMLETTSMTGGGGGSRGVGPMLAAMYRFTNQGYINRKSLPELEALGLVTPGTDLKTTTSGTTVGPMKGAALAAQNPFLWTQQVLIPAIMKLHPKFTDADITNEINNLVRGNQLAASGLLEYYKKPFNFERNKAMNVVMPSPSENLARSMQNDPVLAHMRLAAAWDTFKTSVTMDLIPIVIPALQKLGDVVHSMAMWARENPQLTKGLVVGIGTLVAAVTTAGFIAGIGALASAIGIVGPYLPALAGIIAGIGAWFGLGPASNSKGTIDMGNVGSDSGSALKRAFSDVWGMVAGKSHSTYHITLQADGREIARTTFRHAERDYHVSSLHGSYFDPSMTPTPAGMPQ